MPEPQNGVDAQTAPSCLDALGKMAGGIVHDFNNLLMPILGLTDFVLADPDIMDNREDQRWVLPDLKVAVAFDNIILRLFHHHIVYPS